MKRFMFALLCVALLCFSCAAFAQDSTDPQPTPQDDVDMTSLPIPFNPTPVDENGNSVAAGVVVTAKNASASGAGIPLWSYQVTSPIDGNTYTGVMVGRSPLARGTRTTSIPVVIIPVRIYIAATNRTFDPTASDPGCIGAGNTALSLTQASPIFQNFNWVFGPTPVGNTQYIDATQRANFWTPLGANGGRVAYHTLLGPVTVAPLQTVVAPTATQATSFSFGGQCGNNPATGNVGIGNNVNLPGRLGVFDINWWDPQAEAILAALHVPATSFPLFIFYNAVMSNGAPANNLSNCCILGYHSDNSDTSPNLITTYGNADFDGRNQTLFTGTGDTSVMAHEVNEWTDDPLGNNLVPAWGHIGQQSGCQNNLEAGDPLSPPESTPLTATMPNGFTYHLQDLGPYFSWFFRTPPIGVNGWFDNKHVLATDAGPVCH